MWNLESTVAELLPAIREALAKGEEFLLYPRGESMLPLIRPARDAVSLTAPENLRKNDVCLYQRENGRFVLHRLVRIEKDGTLTFRGDNQPNAEKGIARHAVIARVSAIIKDGTRVSPTGKLYLFTHCSLLARRLRFGKNRGS